MKSASGRSVSKSQSAGPRNANPRRGRRAKRPDPLQVWADVEERFAPLFTPTHSERVVYFRLLRETRLKGVRRVCLTLREGATWFQVSANSVRSVYQRLEAKGAIRLLEKGLFGHWIEVRLPREIPLLRRTASICAGSFQEMQNFFRSNRNRLLIYERERHRCFYCLRRLTQTNRCIDHVTPRSEGGNETYRNLVACCQQCNYEKNKRPALQFIAMLQRRGVITPQRAQERLQALRDLRAGKLRPPLERYQRLSRAA